MKRPRGPTKPAGRQAVIPPAAAPIDAARDRETSQISFSDLSLHALFEQQAAAMLDRADIGEEQKQSILVAMTCPCCAAGGMSFSVRLKKGA